MPPLERRRRRRSVMPTLLVALAVAILLGLLIGGAFRVGRASGPYREEVNRSYVAQGVSLVEQSNRAGNQLALLMARMPRLHRRALQEELDSLASATIRVADTGAALAPPTPSSDLARQFSGVMADRARAVVDLRSAVDGLLGMVPLPVVGAPTTTTTAPSVPAGSTLLSAGQAAADLTRAGSLLQAADRGYAAVRRQFRAAPGRAALPPSVWVRRPQRWSAGTVQTLVGQVGSSATLVPHHLVVLLTNGIRLSPPAVPPGPSSPPGTSTVTPTHALSVTAVVANQGDVDEPKVTVSAQLQGGGTRSRVITLVAGRSVAVVLPPLRVTPGDTYTLTVAVTPPAAQTDRSRTTRSYTVRVAPSSTTKGSTTQGSTAGGSTPSTS
ncbi:MAG TPA: hypothetical protein VHW47_01865 [Acidimicrobiales bacterium]|nr:hypothetical protein [Acidimicrobiales bacterium]